MSEQRGRLAKASGAAMPRRVPVRTCIVCREQAGKRALTRLVRRVDGVYVDPSGKQPGRGAYLCDSATCWEKAASGDVLAKALRTTLTPEDRHRIRNHKAAP
ncbi:MAG: YlxR family protein [Anaerolineae bacterium]|nr:YlxR family protein [Anaerolineae bacterium]